MILKLNSPNAVANADVRLQARLQYAARVLAGIAVRLCVIVGAQCVCGFVLVRGDSALSSGTAPLRARSKLQSYHNFHLDVYHYASCCV
jgi:hypothetical protein